MDTARHKPLNKGQSSQQLLRINDIVAMTTLSKSCVRLWIAQGRFPPPLALSSTLKVWRSTDVFDWIEQQFGGSKSSHPSASQHVASTARNVREASK